MGVGSNLIVRDGGIEGVVIRLGRGFNAIATEGARSPPGQPRSTPMWPAGRGGGHRSRLPAHDPRRDRRRGADERRLLRALCR
jgi:hypothetical protein